MIALQPGNDARFAVSTTFGLLETRDGGANFDFICESVLGVSDGEDAALALTSTGTLLVGSLQGAVTSSDGCAYRAVSEFARDAIADLTLSRSQPSTVFGYRLVGIGDQRFESQVIRSDDDGQSWTRLEPLPEQVLPLTIDVAPSDPLRVYLTARLDDETNFASVLLRSDDGGSRFEVLPVPGTAGQRLAFIAAVHPHAADSLYVRVDDPAGTVIWRTVDGGQSFDSLFTGTGRVLGFALSPGGDKIALGGPSDGLWLGNADGSALERRSDVGPTCLAWSASGLYACADAALSGFSIGRSTDEGASFSRLLDFADLCGTSACGELTRACDSDWQLTAPTLGASCGLPRAVSGETEDGGVPEPFVTDTNPAPEALRLSGGCSVATGSSDYRAAWPALLAGAWLLRRRKRVVHDVPRSTVPRPFAVPSVNGVVFESPPGFARRGR